MNTRERGQILVIVAVGLTVFLGFAALVVDIGMAYATERYQRNLTDSASLAGGQELQQPGTRTVTADDRTDAREIAMTNLMNELAPGDPLPGCGTTYTVDFADCNIPGTNYFVSMATPSPLCVTCDEDRSLMVVAPLPQPNKPIIGLRRITSEGESLDIELARLNSRSEYRLIRR